VEQAAGWQVIGREPELARLRGLASGRPGALVLTGGPGIGKTTLWEAGVEAAREAGVRVLAARPSGAEAQHSFATLIDLFDGVETEELAGLPAPQLRALEVALLRVDPGGAAGEAHAIAVGVLNAMRSLAARTPLLVAVDDLQWLDPPSSDALASAARRLKGEPIGFLLARRPGEAPALERELARRGLERLEVAPLSLGALRRLLSDRLGLSLPRHLLRRIVDVTLGNPLFALELGRTLAERDPSEIGADIPFPDTVDDVLGTRVTQLPDPVRRVLLAVALDADLRVSQLAAIAGPEALEDAVEAGVVVVDGERVRPSHPLLAAAAKRHARAAEQRELHLELAAGVADENLRVRHLALATRDPDASLAAAVAAAAAAASARGLRHEAVELGEHALRLTPPDDDERPERVLALGEYLARTGRPERVTALLEPELESLPPGRPRGRALVLLAGGRDIRTREQYDALIERALAEAGDDPVLRAHVLAVQADTAAAVSLTRIREAEAWALEALPNARLAGPDVEQLALYALAWTRSFSGRPIDDLREQIAAGPADARYLRASLDRVACDRLAWRGEIEEARSILRRLMALADERGEARAYTALLSQLCEVEVRAGDFDAASALLDEWDQSSSDRFAAPVYERCRCLVAAGRGDVHEVERLAAEVFAKAATYDDGWDLFYSLWAHGAAALLAHEPARAVESLRRVWAHMEHEGIEDPGAFPVAPDLVEALVEVGDLAEAERVTERLARLADEQQHPWGLVGAKRCRGLVAADYDATVAGLSDAAAAYGELGLRFDRARSLLALGRTQRRLKKWGAARASLEQAVAIFDELGSVGWAADARAELARVGARRPAPTGDLTPSERRVVELAVEGLSNKEIAQALFVAVNTVETHLSHAYAKLGVRSRAQLARRLSA
jgi:DNA-binding CsgD family transcriptional regulator